MKELCQTADFGTICSNMDNIVRGGVHANDLSFKVRVFGWSRLNTAVESAVTAYFRKKGYTRFDII